VKGLRGLAAGIKARAQSLQRETTALYYAYRDPRTPLRAKAAIAAAIGYALSPIDLIPDFIPVLGYLDDLVLVPALLALAVRMVPPEVLVESRIMAERNPVALRKNPVVAVLIVAVWALVVFLVVRALLGAGRRGA
jgi:uncharacterized membrane protein YkvA (DUF1232 family)